MRKVRVYPDNLRKSASVIEQATEILWAGGVIIAPTDTVYGILADATKKEAVEKIYQIKKRSWRKPLPVFCSDLKMVKKVAEVNARQEKILARIWPGTITVVLPNKRKLPAIVTNNLSTIAVRIPNYKLINYLLEIYSRPIIGTSANISGQLASTKIKEVIEQFNQPQEAPDLLLDAGNLKNNSPSTVIDLVHQRSRFLRVGPVKKEDLEKILDR